MENNLTRHNYRSGARIRSLEDIEPNGDSLVLKLRAQACEVGVRGNQNNIYSPAWRLKYGGRLALTRQDELWLLESALVAQELGILGSEYGYKLHGQYLCHVRGRGNKKIKASSNTIRLYQNHWNG